MKATSIILFILLLPIVGLGQGTSSFDFIVGVENSHRYNLNSNRFNSISLEVNSYGARSEYELKKKGWRIGFNYNRTLFESWQLKLGFRIANGGFLGPQLNDVELQVQQAGVSGSSAGPVLVDRFQKRYNFYFLEIPLAARYEFNDAKFSPFVEYGIAPNILIGSQVTEITNNSKKNVQMEDLTRVHMVAFISAGFNFHYNEGGTIFFQPIYRYHFTTLQVNSSWEDHLYNFGFELGLRRILE